MRRADLGPCEIVEMPFPPLPSSVVDQVVERFGFVERPSSDLDGLHALYSAWCRNVPFDNLRKLVALHYELPELPGIRPDDFFAGWQLTGAGATCWGSNNALHALLTALGFDARLHAASMFDGEINHGTTLVHLDGERWLVDTAVHSDLPVAVRSTPTAVDHAGHVTTVRPDERGWVVECPTPTGEPVPCRLHQPIDHDATLEANERTRAWSPFNDRLRVELNDAHGVWLLEGNTLHRVTAEGRTVRTLLDAEVDEWIVEIAGHAPQLVREVRDVLVARGAHPGP